MNRSSSSHSFTSSLRHSVTSAAFTITELLVVITLIVILILIAVPSFSAMIYSSEEAMAEGSLRGALRAARDAAIRSNGAGDGAAVFFFEPGGRTTVLPCVKVGELSDWADASNNDNNTIRRDVFAAAPGFTAVALPKFWNVRAFIPAYSVSDEWYGLGGAVGSGQAPTVDINNDERAWVFPETGFYNVDTSGAATDGYKRSTFMVRFRAGSGEMIGASTTPALVFAPRPTSQDRSNQPYARYRADQQAEDPVRFIRMVLGKNIGTGNPNPPAAQNIQEKRRLIGRLSGDMVLARPVMQLALYNERRLAEAFGARLDRTTDCVYKGPALDASGYPDYSNYRPEFIANTNPRIDFQAIARFIEGDENLDNAVTEADRTSTRIYAIDRYSGSLRKVEVQP